MASTGWVAFIDDDAEAAPDWCESLAAHFNDSTIGCVGGPIVDFVGARSITGWFPAREPVARIGYAGRAKNHLHDRPDSPRCQDVDFLPGSNMALRVELARKADHGDAPGLAPNEELEWCLTVKDSGYRVVYDSSIRVAHYPAARIHGPGRDDKVAYAYAYAYTLTHTMLRHFGPVRSIVFLGYFWLIGQRVCPGAVFVPFIMLLRPSALTRTAAGMRGRWRAMRDSLRPR
jgi:GT2 family glycosyltransferase